MTTIDWVHVVLRVAMLALAAVALVTWARYEQAALVQRDTFALPAEGGPYVFVEPGPIYNLRDGNLQAYVVVWNANAEHHAALISTWVGVTVRDAAPAATDMPQLLDLGTQTQDGGTILAPREAVAVHREYGRPENVDAILAGTEWVYVFGHVGYRGPNGKRHITTFCFVFYGSETSNQHDGYDAQQARRCQAANTAD